MALKLADLFAAIILLAIGVSSIDARKMDDKCDDCKTFVAQLEVELRKTRHGNFGGGNTAWEERKLGDYLSSEIRYEEMTEKLCTKGQDTCHQILEEHEDYLLDQFKTNNQLFETMLRKTFCIEIAQTCCQAESYGPTCEKCEKDEWNAICSNHGKCDGDGRRDGNGGCICDYGYEGERCEECMESHYPKRIKASSMECAGCPAECSTCLNSSYCASCKPGYDHTPTNTCVDINECDRSPSVCQEDEECVNTQGRYQCKGGDEVSKEFKSMLKMRLVKRSLFLGGAVVCAIAALLARQYFKLLMIASFGLIIVLMDLNKLL